MNWDQITTNLGNSLIGMQQPFGMPQPVDPAQRQQMIAQSLMTLGGNISANKKNPVAGLGAGVSQLKAQGLDEMGRMAYFQQVQDTATERKAKKEALNQTREWARKHPAFKDLPVDSMDGEDILRYYTQAQKPKDMPASWDAFQLAQQNPEYAEFLNPPKEEKARPTSFVDIGGIKKLVYTDTGEEIKDMGPSATKQSAALPADLAGRVGMIRSFLDQADGIEESIRAGDVTGPIDGMSAQLGIGKAGSTYRRIQSGVDALIRAMTGAGMPASEAAQYATRYLPMPSDQGPSSDPKAYQGATIDKFMQLKRELSSIKEAIEQGRGAEYVQGLAEGGGDSGGGPAPGDYKIISVE